MKKSKNKWTASNLTAKITSNIAISVLVLSIGILCLAPIENSVLVGGEETQIYRSAGENGKGVSLMFNVYWGTDEVYQILDVLEKNDVKATFFIGG